MTTATDFPIDPELLAEIESTFRRPLIELVPRPTEWTRLSTRRTPGTTSSARRRRVRSLTKRDGSNCFYCGVELGDDEPPTLDHVLPNSLVRTWRTANLVLSCEGCNEGKSDRIPAILMPLLAVVVFTQARLIAAQNHYAPVISETNGDK